MRVFLVGVMITLLTLPAYAQGMFGGGSGKRNHAQKSEAQPKRPRNEPVITPAPNNNAPAGPFDPWRNVRGTEAGKDR